MSDTPTPRTLPPEALDRWAELMRSHFDLEADQVPVTGVLDLAREVAGGVARPGAPLGAFVAGLVAGRAGAGPEDVRAALAAVVDLVARYDEGAPDPVTGA
ncbi:DUF6457 domain-containing protein [Microbacterium invictum]|uniref:DUF6457 domain-containing protein n=1 Tax=Microbacterium invictum TaxID=515415 RepID=A0ABZ0VFU3_9MICO|nr:DUF6457 domain-containing protein [Microbacterium invictum]WQB71405.1 DUF6457 domain-containing protein [Microbacterium invictum]